MTLPSCAHHKYDWPYLNLYFLADWHWGSPQCRTDDCKAIVQVIKKDTHARWIGMGDLMENSLAGSTGCVYEQDEMPNTQLIRLAGLLKPIADKCIGIIDGNHGHRTMRAAGLNPDQILAANINCMGAYKGISWIGIITVQRRSFRLFCHHTTGGGRTIGGKLNCLKRMAEVVGNADLYVGAHDHSEAYVPDRVFSINDNCKPSVQEITRHFFRCGSLLDYFGSYAERKMFPPAARGQLKLTLRGAREHSRLTRDKKGRRVAVPRRFTFEYLFDHEED